LETENEARLTLGLFSLRYKTKTWTGNAHKEETLNSGYVKRKRWGQRHRNGKREKYKHKGE